LLGNAWKFTSKCENPRIELGRLEKKRLPIYFVRDNGAGFDMSYADKLFGPFQRFHEASDFEGTEWGSRSCNASSAGMGDVWAEAEVDRGATFHFTLKGRRPPE